MNLPRVLPRLLSKTAKRFVYRTAVSDSSRHHLEPLRARSLIKLDGPDAAGLLQGLITNDINQLSQQNHLACLYAMFLNAKGRIICDSIIYTLDKNSYVVEADVLMAEHLMKHLRMYKLKKQVEIKILDSYKVYALYDPSEINNTVSYVPETFGYKNTSTPGKLLNNMYIFNDPRVSCLGSRILAKEIVDHDDLSYKKVFLTDKNNYKWFRYNLGVAEGFVDIPPHVCFPLEHNCDYMNGLNLHKGCYLGQEITARTFHTGKIRKRIMPLILKKELHKTPTELNLKDGSQNSLGKLRGIISNVGLGLLRMQLVANIEINIGDTQAIARIPHWWPGSKLGEAKLAERSI